jgi:hypothetical protein
LIGCAAAGVGWPLPEGWDEERVGKALFAEQRPIGRFPERVRTDFPALHAQLQQHRHLTLQWAWEEYRQLDDRDHFLENPSASVASLRRLITSIPER